MAGVVINDGNDVRAPRYLDLREGKIVSAKSVPYDSKSEALAAIPITRRCEGFRVKIKNATTGKIEDWEFNAALNDLTLREEGSGTVWNYAGDWDEDTTYAENDVVNNDGSSFIAKVSNTGIIPANGDTWGIVAEKGNTGSGGGTTADTTIVATEGQTVFSFSGVPSSYNDYIIFVWGVAAEPDYAFTASGNNITFTAGLTAGDRVRYKRIK